MTSLHSHGSSFKRIKLEGETLLPTYKDLEGNEIPQLDEPDQEDSENSCSICLHSIADRTVIPKCSHEFCFECLLVWTEQSRRCPLCSQAIGEYLIHSIRSRYDYRKHYLSPLRTLLPSFRPAQTNTILQTTRQRRREHEWGTRTRESDEADKLERSIAKRRWIYRHDLYAKHVASNAYTKYRPYPIPAQFAASQDLISRTTTFLRRELQIWEGLDVEFLTTLIISLMKSIDIRSESAVKLISEFLDMDVPYTPGGRHVNAEHFAHEVYSYVRSPYKDLFVYDTVVQYDTPSHLSQPTDVEQSRRWRESSPVRILNEPSADRRHSRKRSRSISSERSTLGSPSGRKYSPTGETGGSDYRNISMSRRNSRSPFPSCDMPKSWDKRLQNANSGHIGRQNHLADASQTLVVSASNERGKTATLDLDWNVKGKRKADEIGMTTSLTGPDSEIMQSNFSQPLGMTDKDDELGTRNMKPLRVFRLRNRTLPEFVKAHLAVPGESAQPNGADRSPTSPESSSSPTADPVPSLLTRLSDFSSVPTENSTKARNVSGGRQQNAGDRVQNETWQNESSHARHQGQNLLHHDIDNSSNSPSFEQQRRQNSSSASPILCQNSTETLTTVEDNNTMAISSYQCTLSRSPVPSSSQKKFDNGHPSNQFHNQQLPHVQPTPRSSIDAVGHLNLPNQSGSLARSPCLNLEPRTKLLARLEIEKRHVVQRSATDNNDPPRLLDHGPSCSSSFLLSKKSSFDRGVPLHLHERGLDVLDSASDPLVSEESRKNESNLRARVRLRVRLAAEKRLM